MSRNNFPGYYHYESSNVSGPEKEKNLFATPAMWSVFLFFGAMVSASLTIFSMVGLYVAFVLFALAPIVAAFSLGDTKYKIFATVMFILTFFPGLIAGCYICALLIVNLPKILYPS